MLKCFVTYILYIEYKSIALVLESIPVPSIGSELIGNNKLQNSRGSMRWDWLETTWRWHMTNSELVGCHQKDSYNQLETNPATWRLRKQIGFRMEVVYYELENHRLPYGVSIGATIN